LYQVTTLIQNQFYNNYLINSFNTMKTISKLTLTLLLASSFVACKGTKGTSTTDTTKVTDSTKTTVVDTVHQDTTKKDTTHH